MLLERYRSIFNRLYGEDRDLTLRRGSVGYLLGLLSTAAFTLPMLDCDRNHRWTDFPRGHDNVPDGVQAGSNYFLCSPQLNRGMYEDNLYLSNLYEFLEQDIPKPRGWATKVRFLETEFASRTCHLDIREVTTCLKASLTPPKTWRETGYCG